MKLNYDRKSKDPTYFVQIGIRNGKKVTTKNIERIGKHSELLKITKDPLSYARKRVDEFNKQIKEEKLDTNLSVDLNEKIKNTGDTTIRQTLKADPSITIKKKRLKLIF